MEARRSVEWFARAGELTRNNDGTRAADSCLPPPVPGPDAGLPRVRSYDPIRLTLRALHLRRVSCGRPHGPRAGGSAGEESGRRPAVAQHTVSTGKRSRVEIRKVQGSRRRRQGSAGRRHGLPPEPDDDGDHRRRQDGRKGAYLHTAGKTIDVSVVARGYRPQSLLRVSGERVVRMQPGIPVTVTLPSLPFPKGVRLSARIVRRSYDWSNATRSNCAIRSTAGAVRDRCRS